MSDLVNQDQAKLLEQVLVKGDTKHLSPEQKVQHLQYVCNSLGMNPATRPFEYIMMNGKEVLYAKRDATDQLRKLHKISVKIASRELVEGIYVVTAEASMPDGRTDTSIGAVAIANLRGDNLANAYMKAETKAKRRVTLSICGLGFLDETEVETIQASNAEQITPPPAQPLPADLGDFVCMIGKKFTGKKLKDIPIKDLSGFVQWIRGQDKPSPSFNHFAQTAESYLEQQMNKERLDPEDKEFPWEIK